MNIWHVIILAIVQGLAELLPVSSSAHVIVAEELMGMNPTAPAMTVLLVMLHTGTMFAVIVYFWRRWREAFFQSWDGFKRFAYVFILANVFTGVVGLGLLEGIEKIVLRHQPHAWIEQLFGRLDLMSGALAAVGVLILIAGLQEGRGRERDSSTTGELTARQASLIGAVQGVVLPFRGFSRSGGTISAGLLSGVTRRVSEDFSFALAVAITPAAIARELWRMHRAQHLPFGSTMLGALSPSLIGMGFSFVAGLLALKWLSQWLETGRWYWFGIYCLFASGAVAYLYHLGY